MNQPYKFYIAKATNNKHPIPENKQFLKFGITHHMDAAKRFDPTQDDGYDKKYEDWDFRIMFSLVCKTREQAELIESYWLGEVFPADGPTKVWVESYLGLEDDQYYSDMSGITELRLLSQKQAGWAIRKAYELYKPNQG